MLAVLECVEKAHKPGRLDGRENVTLHKNVLDLVHLGQRALAHLLESADLSSVALPCEEHGAVTALADLSDDVERVHASLGATLAQEHTLATSVADELLLERLARNFTCRRVLLEHVETLPAIRDVTEKVKVVVKEV